MLIPTEDELQAENKRKCTRHILLGISEVVYFVGDLALILTLLIYFGSSWAYFYLIILVFEFILCCYYFYYHQVTDRVTQIVEVFPLTQCLLPTSLNQINLRQWSVYRNTAWGIYILLWLRSSYLQADAIGTTWGGLGLISYANKSSCNNVYFSNDQAGDCLTNNPGVIPLYYNPAGAFSAFESYIPDGIYANCYMDQTWAWSPANTADDRIITGYSGNGANKINCASKQNNGYPSLTNCYGTQGNCLDAFPDPTVGIYIAPGIAGISTSSTNNTVNIQNCPGNSGQAIISSVAADPNLLCPYCLWYWMNQASQNGQPFNIPIQIANQCLPGWNVGSFPSTGLPYSTYLGGNSYYALMCSFCPGRGYGFFASEKYDQQSIINAYWLYTTISFFLPLFRNVILLIVVCQCSTLSREMRLRRRQQQQQF